MKTLADVIQTRDTYWVSADDTVQQVVHYLCERNTGAVAVKDNDDVVGIFTERDLLHRVVNNSLDPNKVLVRDVMSTSMININMDDEIHKAKAMMHQNGVRHLLVLGNGGVYKGLVSMRDLVEADIADSLELIHRLNDIYYEDAYKSRWRVSSNRVIVEPYVPDHES